MTDATILAVDDRPDNLFVLRALVDAHLPGCRIVTASNALDGLAIARSEPIDAAIIDVRMPEVDGVEMVRRLKADPATAPIPALLLTAAATSSSELSQGLAAGADDFLTKPIDAVELVARIRVLLRMKAAEDQLRAVNADLRETVVQRTAALEHTELQLRQAQKMEIVGRLAAGVAHDFNNLLTAVAGHADLLAASLAPDDPAVEDVAQIQAAVQRAGNLSKQLLGFSRRTTDRPGTTSVRAAVETAHRMMERVIGEDVRLECRLGTERDTVRIDPVAVEQIVLNLLVNARDAMPSGGLVTIATRTVAAGDVAFQRAPDAPDAPDAYVCLEVADTGCGMDADTVRQVFDPFFTTKDVGQGTGLGLAVVQGLVERARGYVDVRSEPGLGTRFAVYLPRTDARDAVVTAAPPPRPAPGGETVLLVEDDPAVRRVTERILRRSGYTVIATGSAERAEALTREGTAPPDVVVTDVILPSDDGVRLVRRLRERHAGLAAVYVSGHGAEALETRGAGDEAAHLLQKPFEAARLLDMVQSALAARPR